MSAEQAPQRACYIAETQWGHFKPHIGTIHPGTNDSLVVPDGDSIAHIELADAQRWLNRAAPNGSLVFLKPIIVKRFPLRLSQLIEANQG